MSSSLIVCARDNSKLALLNRISLFLLQSRCCTTKHCLNITQSAYKSHVCSRRLISSAACVQKSMREPLTKEDYKQIYEGIKRPRWSDVDLDRYGIKKDLNLQLQEDEQNPKKEKPLTFRVGPDNYFSYWHKIKQNRKNIILGGVIGTLAYFILFGKDKENVELHRVMTSPIAELDLQRDGNILRMAMAEKAFYGKSNKIYQDRLKLLTSEKNRMAALELKEERKNYKVIPKKSPKSMSKPDEEKDK